jgi:hypothetical protein
VQESARAVREGIQTPGREGENGKEEEEAKPYYGGGHVLLAESDLAISLRVWRRQVNENVLESEHHPVALRVLLSGDVVLGRGRKREYCG